MNLMMNNGNHKFHSKSEIETLVNAFNNCTLPKNQWNHAGHLSIALWYLIHYEEKEAITQIQNRIQSYNNAMGIQMTQNSGYHQTLTLFWTYFVRNYLSIYRNNYSLVELTNNLIENYCDRNLPLQYYSENLLMSWEARQNWVEPDLKAIQNQS